MHTLIFTRIVTVAFSCLNMVGAATALYSKHRKCCTLILCRDFPPPTAISVVPSKHQSQTPDSGLFFLPLLVYSCPSPVLSLLTSLCAWLTELPLDTLPVMILELISCQGLSGRASTIHPIPGSWSISWLISNLLRKWVSAFLLPGTNCGGGLLTLQLTRANL